MTPGVTMTGVETQAPGWGQWAAFPGDPPPRPAASPEHPVPPRPPVAAPGSGTAGASGPASGRGRGRGAWGAAARRQEAPSCSPGEGGGVRRGHCWWRAPKPSGSRCSHRVRTCCPRPGGSGWRGRPPAGPRRRRGHVAPAWLQPSREGGRLASGPHRRERLVTPAQSAVRCPSRWFPRGALGLQAYLRGEGPGCGGRDGSVAGPSAWRSAPSAWCPLPPPLFSEKRGHTRELDFT